MELALRTALARRRIRRKHSRKQNNTLFLIGILLLICLIPAGLFGFLRPKLSDYAENYIQYEATAMMEQAVADSVAEIDEIGQTHTSETGAVTALTTDTAAVNRLRTRIVKQVYDNINSLDQVRTSVDIGTLLDPEYLAGFGPKMPYSINALGQVTAQVVSDFSEAGINQTRYEVRIHITADFSLHTFGKTKNVTISAEYPLEETIIVGEVPMIAAK